MKKLLILLLKAGLLVGVISTIYNTLIFYVFSFWPDLSFEINWWRISSLYQFLIIIFLKNFLVGIFLMFFYDIAYTNISNTEDNKKKNFLGIFFFILYGIFALLAFSVADMALFQTNEGIIVLVTVDGIIETLIATIPIRLLKRG